MSYEVLFYDGYADVPGYYLIDFVEGRTPEDALRKNLKQIIGKVRDPFSWSREDLSDKDIQDSTYVLRDNGLVSAKYPISTA